MMDTAQPSASLIDGVAAAICEAGNSYRGIQIRWRDLVPPLQEPYLAQARAAIGATETRERELRETLGIALLAMRFATAIRAVNDSYDFSSAIAAAEKALYRSAPPRQEK